MAEVLIPTPIDEVIGTGLTLPIAPKGELLPRQNRRVADEHHLKHPKNDPILRKKIVGPAQRGMQLQIVERDLHNEGPFRYHHYFGGSKLAETNDELYVQGVPAAAGFIARQVIDTRALVNGDPHVREATMEEWLFLRTEGGPRFIPFGYRYMYHHIDSIREFFMFHLANQNVADHPDANVEAFLSQTDVDKKLVLGSGILRAAIEVATSTNLTAVYHEAYAHEQLHPTAPSTPEELVGTILGADNPSFRTVQVLDKYIRVGQPVAVAA